MAQAVLLTLQPHVSGYCFPITNNTRIAGEELLRQLEVPGETKQLVNTLHRFVYPFLSHQDIHGKYNKWDDILECFTAIHFLQSDGTFSEPEKTTQYFAKCKYLCRAATLYEAATRAEEHGEDPQKSVISLFFASSPLGHH